MRLPALDEYEGLRREAERAAAEAKDAERRAEAARRVREETDPRARSMEAQRRAANEARATKAWSGVEPFSSTPSLPRARRLAALQKYLTDFPSDNPHREEAERYVGLLKAGKEPTARPEGMVEVPAGRFFMGCNEKVDHECYGDEKPGKTIELPTFFIDRTEVTVDQYAACVKDGRCSEPNTGGSCTWKAAGKEDHPVNCVDWEQARTYCTWAKKRLPKEAEWEKAARGADGRKYPWGNENPGRTRANLGGDEDGFGMTSPVGEFPSGASPYGALDMSGNVWEWTDDWYDIGKTRPLRGGAWNKVPRLARASYRNNFFRPSARRDIIGFRCAHSP